MTAELIPSSIREKLNKVSEEPSVPQTPSMSYLNNDNIDSLKPSPRRRHVSSISLSDQVVDSFPNLLTLNDTQPTELTPLESNKISKFDFRPTRMSFSSISKENPVKIKKEKIDHERIASYAFAFDIDGVLVRGPDTLQHGVEAIDYLNGNNPYNIKVPYIFVTNGGGKHESIRANDLSKRLKTNVAVEQIVQGHTPMKELANDYKTVLVVGGVGNTCRNIAKDYGFKNVYTTYDIMKWDPSVTPYYAMTEEDLQYCKECGNDEEIDFSKIKIDAIMVFADSRNWAVDQQIILELLMSKNGYMGTISDNFEDGPPIYFAHSDFVWSTNYKLVRYGMGALQVSIAALFREHTNKELKVIRFGKPQRRTFKFAEKVLHDWRKEILSEHVNSNSSNLKPLSVASEDATTQFSDLFSSNEDSDSAVIIDEEEDEVESDLDSKGLTLQSLNKLSIKTSNLGTGPSASPLSPSYYTKQDIPPPSTVYFVGDTPESDIRFANSHDESWYSILVKTGVYQPNTEPKYQPKKICENVLDAVKFAVELEHEKELKEWNLNAVESVN